VDRKLRSLEVGGKGKGRWMTDDGRQMTDEGGERTEVSPAAACRSTPFDQKKTSASLVSYEKSEEQGDERGTKGSRLEADGSSNPTNKTNRTN